MPSAPSLPIHPVLAVALCATALPGCEGGCSGGGEEQDEASGSGRGGPRAREEHSHPDSARRGPPADGGQEQRHAGARLALGGRHSCLLDNGRVWCWGDNRFRQLGDPNLDAGADAGRPRAEPVAGIDGAAGIAAGGWHTCVVRRRGDVACWGHGGFGQLGVKEGADQAEPVDVAGLDRIVELGAGAGHTCARDESGGTWCWGRNDHGQLGDGTREMRAEPARVEGIADAAALAVGRLHTCVMRHEGDVLCWGLAADGQIGDGERGDARGHRIRPVRSALDAPPDAIVAGAAHTCALSGGHVRCWGSDDSGQLGIGSGGESHAAALEPVPMHVVEGAVALVAGGRHTCARTAAGEVFCAGFNGYGQLGDGSTELRPRAVAVRGLDTVREIAAGAHHTCALTGSGQTVCWGRNDHGQLGDGSDEDRTEPARVQGVPTVDVR